MSQTVGTAAGFVAGANPNVPLGQLNRLRGNIVIPAFPELNVTASYLGKEGIRFSIEGESTDFIQTMTGAVLSKVPYMMVSVSAALLKTQALSTLFKAQMEQDSAIGNITVIMDASNFPSYTFNNCAIESVRELNLAGDDAGFVITIKGYYMTNNVLWSLT